MLLGIAGFMRFYSKGLYALPGQHLSKVLPDGSKVHLNAGTRLSYHPHWWRFTRILELDGEAYFEVEKGKKFVVRSQQGKTEVLGTSFNIYSRNSEYRVYCLTGQVKVQTDVGEGKILQANQSLSLTEKGDLEYQSDIKADNAISWTRNEFVFTAVPLSEVFKEMERQFDIEIELGQGVVGEYTGNFERGSSPSNTLEMITRPFGLYVERIHQNKYRISREKD
jgi:ferric-dicitrate binding protein FerR (iron transport regulator)